MHLYISDYIEFDLVICKSPCASTKSILIRFFKSCDNQSKTNTKSKNSLNYDLLFFYLNEILSTCFIICALLINVAHISLQTARFIAFDTPLDMLPKNSGTNGRNWELIYYIFLLVVFLYSVDFLVLLSSLEVLHSYISYCIVKLLVFYLKCYAQATLLLIYIYKILSPTRDPKIYLFCG